MGRDIYLILQMTKKWLSWSIVDTVSFSRHRLDTSEFLKSLFEAWMGIMESLIGMQECSFNAVIHVMIHTVELQPKECCLNNFHSKIIRESKGENFSRNHILHDRKIYPFSLESEIGNIRSKFLQWNHPMKGAIQDIWHNRMFLCFLHDLFVGIFSSYFGEEVIFVHQPKNLLVIHNVSLGLK